MYNRLEFSQDLFLIYIRLLLSGDTHGFLSDVWCISNKGEAGAPSIVVVVQLPRKTPAKDHPKEFARRRSNQEKLY